MSESFPTSGGADFLPMTMPSMNEQANIQSALKAFYYNTFDPTSPTSTLAGLRATNNSIASYLAQRAKYADNLSVFASTTSDQLRGIISDETGTGSLVFGTNAVMTTPTINAGTASSLTGLSIRDTSAAYDVTIAAVSSTALTASRTLILDLVNAARTLKLGANLTINSNAVAFTGASGGSSITLPASGTVATLTGTETLANKTLTSPAISTIVNTGTLTLPTSNDTLVGRATTDTLTNKTISGSSNTFSNIPNSATTAVSTNTLSAIVARDGSGNFTAGTITATLSGNASTATNLAGGDAGKVKIVYQSGVNTTSYVEPPASGGNGWLLSYSPTSGPSWTDPTSVPAVNIAANIGSGSLGSVPYQTESSKTGFIAPNTTSTRQFLTQQGTGTASAVPVWYTLTKSDIGLSAVENTALSTWSGTTNITTLGTITSGTWNGTVIANAYIPSALTSKTYNGLTVTSTTGTLTISNAKTLTVSETATISGGNHSGTNTGDQTISLTGDVSATGSTGALTTTIGAGKVTNDMLAGSIANTKLLNNSITFGTTAQALGSTITNIAGVTINSTTIPTSKTLVTTDSTATIAASTTGTAAYATKVVNYGGATTADYSAGSSQKIYVGVTAPTGMTSADIGSIWMW
jgi:hypothetical protein